MELAASLVGRKIPSHNGGHYNFAPPSDREETGVLEKTHTD